MGSKNKNKQKSNGAKAIPATTHDDSSETVMNGKAEDNNDTTSVQQHEENGNEEDEQKKKEVEITEDVKEKDLLIEKLQHELEQLKLSQQQKQEEEIVARAQTENSNNTSTTNNEELESLKAQLEAKTKENEVNETNYRNLLGKLSGMKSLFEKMKKSETELEASEFSRLEVEKKLIQTEDEKNVLIGTLKDLKVEIKNLNSECVGLSERNSILNQELVIAREELEKLGSLNKRLQGQVKELTTNQEEYLIMMNEEKLLRQNLSNKIVELQQVLSFKDDEIQTIVQDKNLLNDKLVKLEETIVIRDSELNLNKEQYNNELKNLENQLKKATNSMIEMENVVSRQQEEITNMSKLEKDNKDKQLQIGKLRHELIILNDHLTKALKLIKQDGDNESVDKQLVSNLFISFLNLPRGDSKKFEALELIANYLNWDKDMRIHAGIQNKASGGGNGELNRSRQSFVSLWTEYLEKESTKEGGKADT